MEKIEKMSELGLLLFLANLRLEKELEEKLGAKTRLVGQDVGEVQEVAQRIETEFAVAKNQVDT